MRSFKICLMKSRGAIAPFIIEDIAEALAFAGHRTLVLDFEKRGIYSAVSADAKIKILVDLVNDIGAFNPDFAFSYGYGGVIDIPPKGQNLFEALKVPYLLLFYDAPLSLAPQFERDKGSDLMHVLCWDKRYVPWLKQQGLKRVFRQPLGTNARVFGKTRERKTSSGMSFVGSIPSDALSLNAFPNEPLKAFARALCEGKLKAPCKYFSELLAETREGMPLDASQMTPSLVNEFMRVADARYRLEAIRGLSRFSPAVHGGASWLAAGLDASLLAAPVQYGEPLAELYASSSININLSSCHLESAVNQRPFDCSAAGGFLLSDWRDDLGELFDPGTEIPVFKTLEELGELSARYDCDEPARRRMAEAARRRTLSCHTWDVRMKALLEWLASIR